jgi:choline kinase
VTQPPEIRTAVLLAAGMGSRLGAGPDAVPKCLIEVGGKSLLQRLVAALLAHGVRRLVIVVGFRHELIREALETLPGEMTVELVHNAEYATTNNIVSLWMARDAVAESFLLVESDLVFAPALLEDMMVPDRVAIAPLLPWMQGTRVGLAADGSLEAFYFPPFEAGSGQYKTVNIYSLSHATWRKICERLGEFIDSGRVGVYYEHAFAELLSSGDIHFKGVQFPNDQWYEVDTPADHAEANRLFS